MTDKMSQGSYEVKGSDEIQKNGFTTQSTENTEGGGVSGGTEKSAKGERRARR
jgi:hypothetical protein